MALAERNPARAAPGLGKIVHADGLNTHRDSKLPSDIQARRSRARKRLNRLTAKLDALAIWRESIDRRIEHAKALFEDGCLYQDQLDALIDAVETWRLVAAHVALDVGPRAEMRRAA